jgi:ribosomal protein RSM22 (predicted rRNA methylase)
VGERKLVGSAYLSRAELRQEYEAEIAPRTAAALGHILGRVAFSQGRPRRVLDLGAGTGAAGRAVRGCFGEDVELVAVDRVPGPGILVADVLRGVGAAGVSGRFDLIVSAHLLNELSLNLDGRARLVEGWCRDLLETDGTCVVIEPALRETSRALLGVRDRLLAAGLHVEEPCFCQSPCPALQRESDWCHDSAGVLVAGRSRVDFSYLVLRRSGAAAVDPGRYRVVSDPIKDKGRLRFFVCGVAGRFPLMRLDRDCSAANHALDQARRGDIVVLPNAPVRDDSIRVAAGTVVELG